MNVRLQQSECWGHIHTETTEERMAQADEEPACSSESIGTTTQLSPQNKPLGLFLWAVHSSGPTGISWKVCKIKQENPRP